MKIYAPVKDANGVYASVRFVNGVGETNDPYLIGWFRSHGYLVPIEEEEQPIEQVVEVNETLGESEVVESNELDDEPDFESMTPLELRDWAKEHDLGLKIGNTRNKEKLIAILRG